MTDSKLPSGIDRVVGQRIRWRRRELKLTQERLGELLELTFQQVQKYEKGVNRVSAGRLYEIAGVLGVPINYFFEGAEEFLEAEHAEFAEDDEDPHPPVMTPETLELISAFQKIEDLSLRKSLLNTVRAAASAFDQRASGPD
ncbi:helix-turn-helix domain-containing protein [Hyphomonas sp.]|uniref:helix-turn-helix domain-containing protein n=1 Tax=Hyphomonas sp. TaxID=87 RepID=UPI0025C0F02A|nr:helix-turn-helix domain-containing protein [Hyphomonas sp.]